MALYEYFCPYCKKEWEAWHDIEERMNEFCCGKPAKQILSIGAIRPNGITEEKPKIPKHQSFNSQIYKDGEKKIDQSVPNAIIAEANKKLDKINSTRGYRADD
jgi:hypothetical protein